MIKIHISHVRAQHVPRQLPPDTTTQREPILTTTNNVCFKAKPVRPQPKWHFCFSLTSKQKEMCPYCFYILLLQTPPWKIFASADFPHYFYFKLHTCSLVSSVAAAVSICFNDKLEQCISLCLRFILMKGGRNDSRTCSTLSPSPSLYHNLFVLK